MVQKVSIKWKYCVLSTLRFDINQKIEKCCVCENSLDENILIPSQCFTINGTRGNRICIDWWFNKFAMENKFHKCPGCNKEENKINK